MKIKLLKTLKNTLIVACLLVLNSCVSTKNVTYFQNLNDSINVNIITEAKFTEPIIQIDDILSITIVTIDPSDPLVLNQGGKLLTNSASMVNANQEIKGYIVDKNGEIELALIGRLKLAGLTTYQARDLIREKASINFKDPSVNVRFANFKVSVLGEVNKPASYTMINEKVTVLDVLSLAGDLTLYGKRENILVVRQIGNKKEFGRINLNSTKMFNSPYYYLKQNDIIYVEPSTAKVSALNAPTRQTLGIVLSAISVIALAFSRVF